MLEKLGSYRKDIQWIAGLIFVTLLTLHLLIFGLMQFFAPEVAKPAISGLFKETIQPMFAKNYEQARSWFQSRSPTEPIEIPGIPKIGITAGEAAQLDAQGLATKISDKLADQIYESKLDSLSPQIRQGIGPLAFFNKKIFETLRDTERLLLSIAALFGIIMFLFGRRFGRIVSLGLAFVVASLPTLLIYDFLRNGLNNPSGLSNASGNPQQAAAIAALTKAMEPAVNHGEEFTGLVFIVGLLLILFAFVGLVIYFVWLAIRVTGDGTTTSGKVTATRQTGAVELHLPYNKTFDLCLASLSEVGGKVKQQERSLGKIVARTGVRWKSYGETIEFVVSMIDDGKSQVQISSKFTIPALFDLIGANWQNVEKISEFLKTREQEYKVSPLPSAPIGT